MTSIVPVNAETRGLRSLAHESFDRLWRRGGFSRGEAYAWLSIQLGLPEAQCHMGVITDRDLLLEIVHICNEYMGCEAVDEQFEDAP